ncbi:MAG: hypothetical protein K2M87_04715 [Muribaculaceae bacterium]|nr:hypothetical protein [Muribaculaceae bacterium]
MFKRIRKQKNEEPEISSVTGLADEQTSSAPMPAGAASESSDDSGSEHATEQTESRAEEEKSQEVMSWEQSFENWVSEQQIGTDDASRLSAKIAEIVQSLAEGGSGEIFSLIEKGLNYETDVEQARAEGEIVGRNARIDEVREIEQATDGVPHPGVYPCAAGAIRTPNIFDLAAQA